MAASFTIAARNNGFSKAGRARGHAGRRCNAYREAMADFARMRVMDIWYARLTEEELMTVLATRPPKARPRRQGAQEEDEPQAGRAQTGTRAKSRAAAKARTRDSLQALSKLAEMVDGEYRIVSQPPIVVPSREL